MKATTLLSRSILLAVLGLGTSLFGCGAQNTTESVNTGGTDSTSVSSSSASAAGGGSSGGGGSAPELKFLAKLDAAKSQIPEGLWVTPDSKTAYLGYAFTGQIAAVTLADDTVADFASVPAPPANKGFVTGITQSAAGDLYVAAATLDPAAYKGGIYKVPAKGGAVTTLFAANAAMTLPNGLVFDKTGNLFVTDSGLGAIFKISADGQTVTKWFSDPLLVGDNGAANPCKTPLGIPFGANGIALANNAFYVANTDKATLIKIPIAVDGGPGSALVFSKSDPVTCLPLQGADGLTADADGTLFVAGNGGNSLVQVGTDGTATVLQKGGLLDGPASVSLATINAKKYALVSNFGIGSVLAKKTPNVGLLSYGPLP
jgi:hypothetical protein